MISVVSTLYFKTHTNKTQRQENLFIKITGKQISISMRCSESTTLTEIPHLLRQSYTGALKCIWSPLYKSFFFYKIISIVAVLAYETEALQRLELPLVHSALDVPCCHLVFLTGKYKQVFINR